jgi:predicted choloylglycine hydrolase
VHVSITFSSHKVRHMKKWVIKMKNRIVMLILLLVLASLLSTYAMDDTGVKHCKNPAILKNEVLQNRDSANYTEVRHIVLKGSNEQIGEALGEIAREDYNVSLYPYADPIYAKARLDYMRKNYPAFYERMKGVAAAYNVPFKSTDLDLSALIYDIGFPECSMVYFPPSVTSNGHAMLCRNLDFDTLPYDEIINPYNSSSQPDVLARTFVLETYPDEGYSSLVLGAVDLLGMSYHGFNSQGLAIDMQYLPPGLLGPANQNATIVGSRNSGISIFDVGRMILDNCKSIDEAKKAMLNNKIYFWHVGFHFMISDKYGKSTIVEFTAPVDPVQDGSIHFTDYSNSKPVVMTNHPVYLFPTIEDVNEYINNTTMHTPITCYYDSWLRYKTLTDSISNHKGKFTPQDMLNTLSPVFDVVTISPKDKSRTLANWLLDLTNSTLSVRFYLRDGWTPSEFCPNPEGHPIIFTPFFKFTLTKKEPPCMERCNEHCYRECNGRIREYCYRECNGGESSDVGAYV